MIRKEEIYMSKDSKMYYLADDIQKIQVKTNMYINEYGQAGSFHLAREVIQNNFDECLDDDSPGKHIDISYDKATDILRCEDDGRSFDESDYPINIFCTTLQSGSKFFRNSGADTAGEFGVGLTVVNALSSVFKITAYREKEQTKHVIEFSEGVMIKDEIHPNKSGKHGTIVEFSTSKKYMGEEAELPTDDVIDWIESLFFLNSDNLKRRNITCKFSIYDGMELIDVKKFKPQPFSLLLNRIIPSGLKKNDLSSLCYFNGNQSFIEESKTLIDNEDGTTSVDKVPVEKNMHIDIALQYVTSSELSDSATYDTYCNYTNTIDNGTHLDAFDESFCRFIQNATNATMSDSQKEKLKITWEDVRTNLFCVINLSTNAHVGFVGNAKRSIDNKELLPYLKDIITTGLTEFFDQNGSILNEYIKIVKLNAKARLEAQKAKTATQTERLNTFKEHAMKNYIRCNNTGKQWKEIFLTEGDSASGSARNGSDPDTQAIFLLRGVVANAMKCSLSEIMENREWRDLVTVLRCGIGEKFDLKKLYFNRINILTDADIDGFYISSGILAFFYRFMRPIIEDGRLYKVFSPLYALDDKEHPFVANKTELISLYHEKIIKTYKVKRLGDDNYLSKSELYDFLIDTYDYKTNLQLASDASGKVNKFLIEIIIAYMTLSGVVRSADDYDDLETIFSDNKVITYLMSNIQKKYKEITLDESGRFSGVVEGKYALVKVSPRFFRKTADLIPIYQKYGYNIIVEEKGKEPKEMSIGEFLDTSMKVMPHIRTRFKGLAELNGKQLRETTLDINHRVSVQYTIDDVERELKIFELTHGDSKKDMENRKKMMKKYKIRRDDLDN